LAVALRWFGLSGEPGPMWLVAVFVVVGAVLLDVGYWTTDIAGAWLWLSGAIMAIRGLVRVLATRRATRRRGDPQQ
jgi:hypothetical protein